MVKMTFVGPDGTETVVDANVGDTVMTSATSNLVPGIIGDCGGGMSCATCHVFVSDEWIDVVGRREGAEDEMLDCTAVPSGPTSRLGCQVLVDERLDGVVLRVPEAQE